MACGGCAERAKVIKQAAKEGTLDAAKKAAKFVAQTAVQDVRDRVRFLTVRRNVL